MNLPHGRNKLLTGGPTREQSNVEKMGLSDRDAWRPQKKKNKGKKVVQVGSKRKKQRNILMGRKLLTYSKSTTKIQ